MFGDLAKITQRISGSAGTALKDAWTKALPT